MLHFTSGNLFDAKVAALVNTVNTVGVMGKGLALEFKQRYPYNYRAYRLACDAKAVKVGKMFTVAMPDGMPKYIINFPTKTHWRKPSQLSYIDEGLRDLAKTVRNNSIESVALPALGCGLGGLRWAEVRSSIERELSELEEVSFYIYEPGDPT